jgi:hypothetical protein
MNKKIVLLILSTVLVSSSHAATIDIATPLLTVINNNKGTLITFLVVFFGIDILKSMLNKHMKEQGKIKRENQKLIRKEQAAQKRKDYYAARKNSTRVYSNHSSSSFGSSGSVSHGKDGRFKVRR